MGATKCDELGADLPSPFRICRICQHFSNRGGHGLRLRPAGAQIDAGTCPGYPGGDRWLVDVAPSYHQGNACRQAGEDTSPATVGHENRSRRQDRSEVEKVDDLSVLRHLDADVSVAAPPGGRDYRNVQLAESFDGGLNQICQFDVVRALGDDDMRIG